MSSAGPVFASIMAGLPSPSTGPTPPAELVTPGVLGFVGIAIVVGAVMVIVWDMQRRIRRTRYRAEVRAELDAEEQAAAAAAAAADTTDEPAPGDEPRATPR